MESSAAQYGQGNILAGTSSFENDGTIALHGGIFGASVLSNAAGATIEGYGDIGQVALTNRSAGDFAVIVNTRNVVNSGTIAPNGVLNAGAITNLSGGSIIGYGTIQSLNTTNSELFGFSSANTGAQIHNDAGATILASDGTLVLSNGLVDNSNAGTLGASNGVLQLGNGTLALTNNGTVSVHKGGLLIGDFYNNGTVEIVDSNVEFSNIVVNAGRYISDPSTNTFFDDVTITASGTLEGGFGDLFDFKQSLFINSTNTSFFDLRLSTVSFSGGGDHTNAITGLDLNNSAFFGETFGFTSSNFAYGTLMLGGSDDLWLIDGDGDGSNSNGLYIGILAIGGTTNDLVRLHSPFNIYYRDGLAENAYLGGMTYGLDGGGFLIAVPEPSAAILFFAGGSLLALRRSRARQSWKKTTSS